ncbi:MAG: alpha-L-fucosidase [Chitinophagaceae bacterium]|nr:alpha-L-fucosidase [Chitinophagaceae bacterium]
MQELSPNTVVFSDIGPHIRWCGNENGIAGPTNWNRLDTAGYTPGAGAPSQSVLNSGNENGLNWIPAECDVSIRPGWFYHEAEDTRVKTAEELHTLYLKSVGRGANLLLNVPPDRRGLIHERDSAALVGFYALRKKNFSDDIFKNANTYHLVHGLMKKAPALSDGNDLTAESITETVQESVGVELKGRSNEGINCIVLKEDLSKGQHCAKFKLLLFNNKDLLVKEITGTTIGRKRIITFPSEVVNTIELTIEEQKGITLIKGIEAYLIPEGLVEK